jgi:hypothetical protein
MENKQQKWFLTVLTTGMEPPSIITKKEITHHPFILIISVICCRAPNPDNVLILQTPLGVISTKSLLQKRKVGSRLISSTRSKKDDTAIEISEHDPFSAARCRIYKRTNHMKKVDWRKSECL